MKRTEIPAVKCYGHAMDGELNSVIWEKDSAYVPCILRTAAADKLILDVVRNAMDWAYDKSGSVKPTFALVGALAKLKKAGVKL